MLVWARNSLKKTERLIKQLKCKLKEPICLLLCNYDRVKKGGWKTNGITRDIIHRLKSLNSLQQSRTSVCQWCRGILEGVVSLSVPRESIPQFIVHRDATDSRPPLAVCLTKVRIVCLRKEPSRPDRTIDMQFHRIGPLPKIKVQIRMGTKGRQAGGQTARNHVSFFLFFTEMKKVLSIESIEQQK